MKRAVAWMLVGVAVAAAAGRDASAQEVQDLPSGVHAHTFERAGNKSPLRGSTLMFDQSVSTQTADVGTTPQSYVPLYELWVSFRPRYWFGDHFSVRARFDYTKELTNDQTTTYYRQDVLGDTWTDAMYSAPLDSLWPGTKADAGLRAIWPTSLASQAQSVYVEVGPLLGVSHEFEIHGDRAPLLNNAHVALRTSYTHTLSETTTPTSYGGFAYQRQSVDEFSFTSDQIAGETLVSDVVTLTAEAGLHLAPRVALTAFGVLYNQWHYPPPAATDRTTTGGATLAPPGGPQFTQNVWVVVGADYLVIDELELSLGYYNLANAVAPDGQLRSMFGADNIWWSPDARFFLSATALLDVIYDDLSKHPPSSPSQAKR